MNLKSIIVRLGGDYKKLIAKEPTFLDSNGKKVDIDYLLEKDINNLYGHEFYYVINTLEIDIESTLKKAFGKISIKVNRKKEDTPKWTKIQRFVYQFITEQKDFANKAGIDPTRLSKILKGDRKDFFAHEVYAIAISQDITPKSAFEQLYKE